MEHNLERDSSLEHSALLFACRAHHGQDRKYTGGPYIEHPIAVANLVRNVTHDSEMIAAAYLHDVVEDTEYTLEDIDKHFGVRVRNIVGTLTNVSLEEGNRTQRKLMNRRRFVEQGDYAVHTIKLADLIHNAESIFRYDPNFAAVFTEEALLDIEVLNKGSMTLLKQAQACFKLYASRPKPAETTQNYLDIMTLEGC